MAVTKPEFDDRVHLLLGITGHAVIQTACGAQMQGFGDEWRSEINHWGKVGIRKARPFTTLTLDPSKVTCRRKGCRND